MFKYRLSLIALALIAFLSMPQAQAADENASSPPVEEKPSKPDINPAVKKINFMLNDLVKKMDEEEKKHFYLGYSNYNLQGTVKMVQADVKNAIEACGKNNPDMKPKLNERYKTWDAAIAPVMKQSEANLDNMINAQDYAPKKDILAVFKQVDDAREKSESQIEKIPVTTPEACEYLINKMDETQNSMLSLLRSTLLTVPQAFGDEPLPVDPKANKADMEDHPPADGPQSEPVKPE